MTKGQGIATLEGGYKQLPEKDQGFALSLVGQFKSRGTLSDKQWMWVGKLADAVNGTVPAQPQQKTLEVGSFASVVELFKLAGEKLKYPRIVLLVEEPKLDIALTLAGAKARRPGTVNVLSPADKDWLGRVTPEGVWEPRRAVKEPLLGSLTALLTRFAKEPVIVAAEFGKLTGRCCFCNSGLTDERSTEVGYGPVCAKQWHMPWGTH